MNIMSFDPSTNSDVAKILEAGGHPFDPLFAARKANGEDVCGSFRNTVAQCKEFLEAEGVNVGTTFEEAAANVEERLRHL